MAHCRRRGTAQRRRIDQPRHGIPGQEQQDRDEAQALNRGSRGRGARYWPRDASPRSRCRLQRGKPERRQRAKQSETRANGKHEGQEIPPQDDDAANEYPGTG